MSIHLNKKAAGLLTYYEREDSAANLVLIFVPFSQESSFPATLSVLESWQDATLQGIYVFLTELPTDLIKVIAAIHQLRKNPVNKYMRFLWIENVAAEPNEWRRQHLAVPPTQGRIARLSFWDLSNYGLVFPSGTSINYEDSSNDFVFTSPATETFLVQTDYGGHKLNEVGSTIRLSIAGLAAACFKFSLDISLEDLDAEQHGANAFGYPAAKHLDIGFRMFFQDRSLPVGLEEDFSLDSLRYPLFNEVFHNHEPAEITANEKPDLKTFYPDKIRFEVQWDWFYPLNENRCFWAVSSSHATGIPSGFRTNLGASVHLKPVPNQSFLVFNHKPLNSVADGRMPFYLAPKGDFELSIPIYDPNSTQKEDLPQNLICGLSGVEYIRVSTTTTTHISFITKKPAFVQNFISVSALREEVLVLMSEFTEIPLSEMDPEIDFDTIKDGAGHLKFGNSERIDKTWIPLAADFFPTDFVLEPKRKRQLLNEGEIEGGVDTPEKLLIWFTQRLRETRAIDQPLSLTDLGELAQTSWAYVTETTATEAAPVYYSQPDQAVMYQDTLTTGNDDIPEDEFLSFMEVPTYRLLKDKSPTKENFPLFPYGGGLDNFYLEDFKQLEDGLITTKRQQLIHTLDQLATSPENEAARRLPESTKAKPQGTTPQGFIATYAKDFGEITKLELAKGTDDNPLQFTKIGRDTPLRATLLSNQLFMVASNPAALRAFFKAAPTDYKLDIDDWLFSMNPDLWESYETLIVFKFHNQSLLELAKNPFSWSQANHFSHTAKRSQTKTQQQLLQILEEAVTKSQSGIIKDKEKYEKLAQAALLPEWSGILAFKAPIDRTPSSIQGLMAGVDASEFFAKYIGIEMTPVKPVGALLVADHSSTFGLIDYENDQAPPPNDSGYNFQVTKLFARFLNASLVDFSSEVAVTIDKLFDEKNEFGQ